MTILSTTIRPRVITSSGGRLSQGVALLVACALVGAAVAIRPVIALVPLAALMAALLLIDGRARIVFVLFGGLLVFQRGEGLDTPKMAFLALFAVAFLGALVNVRTLSHTLAYRLATPLLLASVAVAALAAISLVVAHNNATPLAGWWLRDIAPYLLFATAPFFALDAQTALRMRSLVALLVATGTFGGVAFAIHWLDRRGIAHINASRFGLASHFVAAGLFAYAMSAVIHARRRKWLALASLILALLLITGNRATLVLVLAPLAIALGARRHRLTRSVRVAFVGPVAIAVTLVVAAVGVRIAGADEASLARRLDILRSTASSSDASYRERLGQAEVAWSVATSNPILGRGPGTVFVWSTVDRRQVSSFVLDTPLTFPAKFGFVGLLILVYVVWKYWSFVRSLIRLQGPTIASLALIAYMAIIAGTALGVSPLEDKGLSFGLMLMLALALGEVSRRESESLSNPVQAPGG